MSAWWDAFLSAWDLAPRAMEGGCLAACACGALGVLLRWRRLVWAGFAVPEAATVGVSLALGAETLLPALGLAGAPPGWLVDQDLTSLLCAALAVAWLVPVARAARPGGERAAAACFLLSATLSVLLVAQSPHGTEEVRQLAMGRTLLFLRASDVALLAWTMPAVVLGALLLARPFAAISFDRDHARAVGHPVVPLEAGFALGFLALVAVAASRVGTPFAFVCLTVPAAVAERVVARPVRTVALAPLVAGVGFLLGATASVRYEELDLPFSTSAAAGVLAVAAAAVLASVPARAVRAIARRSRRPTGP